MSFLLLLPLSLQALLMLVDEFIFHRSRGLLRWERIGHPVDSFFMLLVYGVCWANLPIVWFIVLAICSMLIIVKDEAVHKQQCSPQEQIVHALLFMLHPLVIISLYLAQYHPDFLPLFENSPLKAVGGRSLVLVFGTLGTLVMFIHQVIYWNIYAQSKQYNL